MKQKIVYKGLVILTMMVFMSPLGIAQEVGVDDKKPAPAIEQKTIQNDIKKERTPQPPKKDTVQKDVTLTDPKKPKEDVRKEHLTRPNKKRTVANKKQSFAEELNLSRRQIKKLRKHKIKFETQRKNIAKDILDVQNKRDQALLSDSPDEKKIKKYSKTLEHLHKKKDAMDLKSKKGLGKILDKKQLLKFKQPPKHMSNRDKKRPSVTDGVTNDFRKDAKQDLKRSIEKDTNKQRQIGNRKKTKPVKKKPKHIQGKK
jgi:hypothetical protein